MIDECCLTKWHLVSATHVENVLYFFSVGHNESFKKQTFNGYTHCRTKQENQFFLPLSSEVKWILYWYIE